MAKTKDGASLKGKESNDPPKNLQKVSKPKRKEIDARMIIQALNRLDASIKDGQPVGHSLAKIRNYIRKEHGLEMLKHRQDMIKEVISAEFEHGRIEMANHDGSLNFTKRFQATIDDDHIEDEGNTFSSDTDEE